MPASWAELPTRPPFYLGSNVLNFNRLQKKRNLRCVSRTSIAVTTISINARSSAEAAWARRASVGFRLASLCDDAAMDMLKGAALIAAFIGFLTIFASGGRRVVA